jgi:hypothetical protein
MEGVIHIYSNRWAKWNCDKKPGDFGQIIAMEEEYGERR